MFCKNCGKEIDNNADICIHCNAPVVSETITAPADPAKPASKTKVLAIILAVAAVGITVAVILILTNMFSVKAKIRGAYENCCSPSWAYLVNNGEMLVIDANSDQAYEAYVGMQNINRYLELPQSLTDAISETNYFDGVQTREFTKPAIRVTWSYSGLTGFKATYEASGSKSSNAYKDTTVPTHDWSISSVDNEIQRQL
jgi:hypothetical protein